MGSLYVITVRETGREAKELIERIAASPCGLRTTETDPIFFLSDVYERFGRNENSFVLTADEFRYTLPYYFNV